MKGTCSGMKRRERIQIYNTAPEIGTRVLCILNASAKKMGLLRIQIYDHFVLHIGDIIPNETDMHPANPSYASELFGKREAIAEGVHFMLHRGLLHIKNTTDGIYYYATQRTSDFLECLQSGYASELKTYAREVAGLLDSYSDARLLKYVFNHAKNLPGEIEKYLQEKRDV